MRSGNTTSCTFTVTVTDTQNAGDHLPGNLVLTADAGRCSRSNVTFTVEATDNCGVTNLVSSPPSGSTFPVGMTTVTNTATDASGNTSQLHLHGDGDRHAKPGDHLSGQPGADGGRGPCSRSNVTFAVSATDNCGVTNLVSSTASGSTFPVGTTTVTNTATDASGNTSTLHLHGDGDRHAKPGDHLPDQPGADRRCGPVQPQQCDLHGERHG